MTPNLNITTLFKLAVSDTDRSTVRTLSIDYYFVVSRYAYHLRRWTIEGHSLGSHVIRERERGSVVRITVQPAGVQEKVVIELLTTDYVAELRAEVTKQLNISSHSRIFLFTKL